MPHKAPIDAPESTISLLATHHLSNEGGSEMNHEIALPREVLEAPFPENLVKTMAEYSHDPKQLYAYRSRLAELIDRSTMPDADPWGKEFNVRRFPWR